MTDNLTEIWACHRCGKDADDPVWLWCQPEDVPLPFHAQCVGAD